MFWVQILVWCRNTGENCADTIISTSGTGMFLGLCLCQVACTSAQWSHVAHGVRMEIMFYCIYFYCDGIFSLPFCFSRLIFAMLNYRVFLHFIKT